MSLEIKKRGSTWTYVVDVGIYPTTGKRKRKSKGGFKTKGECRAAASKVIAEVESGSYHEISEILIKDFFDKYFDTVKQNLAPTTFTTYKHFANYHLIPKLNKMKLKDLKPIHIQDVYNEVLKTNSPTTVRHIHNFLHKALQLAVKWKLITSNPSDDVEKPKRARVEMSVLDENQLNSLIGKLEKFSIYLFVIIAATTGMREGEICGLTWDNVDLENKIIYVRNQLQRVEGELCLVPPKTNNSRRKIQLPTNIVKVLEKVRINQQQKKTDFGTHYDSRNFVCAQNDGRPYDPGYISRNFNKILREYKYNVEVPNGNIEAKTISEILNLPRFRFHDLRHTHATLLLKAGISVKVVAERLGDTVQTVLNTYAHVLPDMQKEAAEKLNNIFLQPTE